MPIFDDLVNSIEAKYNAEYDRPGIYCHPQVTATDRQLLGLINILHAQIATLEKRIFELEKITTPEVEAPKIRQYKDHCEKCGELAYLSGVRLCPKCTQEWVKNR